ncbi:hypothetical protein [Allorhizobium ampelinum]|uniref:hypothetical protein n=1 Tax=Allorhizobium ampelinum TaxID=3025782 RepID=UPI001F330815|nr:hypothetical protein [Allorhizobium ampelinum]
MSQRWNCQKDELCVRDYGLEIILQLRLEAASIGRAYQLQRDYASDLSVIASVGRWCPDNGMDSTAEPQSDIAGKGESKVPCAENSYLGHCKIGRILWYGPPVSWPLNRRIGAGKSNLPAQLSRLSGKIDHCIRQTHDFIGLNHLYVGSGEAEKAAHSNDQLLQAEFVVHVSPDVFCWQDLLLSHLY